MFKNSKLYLKVVFFILLILFPSFLFCKEVYVIKINGAAITPVTAEYIVHSIEISYKAKTECLIIELDTPGGLLDATRLIVKKILSAKLPIVVYIYPSGSRAGSAGVFITYASHIAAMAPSTNIGAAHPVRMGRTTKEGKSIIDEKILQDTIAFIKSLAQKRNRNVKWAIKSVKESASLTATEALKNKVINIIATSEKDLLEKLNGRKVVVENRIRILNTKNASIKYIKMSFRQKLLNILANPNIAYILLMLGFYGLIFEVTHPGIGVPGIVGVICLTLAFFSLQVLPTNYAGLLLIILGIILFIAEVKVPGFGLLTLGGLVCMLLGSLLLFQSSEKIVKVSLMLIISFTLSTAIITIALVRAVIISHRRKVKTGKEGLIGEKGYAKTRIRPNSKAKVFIHGEIWDAVANEEIKKGGEIEVINVRKMILEVKKAK